MRVPVAAVAAALLFAGPAHAANVTVGVDRSRIATQLGDKFLFRSTIVNRGSTPASGLIAHLNVLSLRSNVYVDPEDWSSRRVRYLATIAPGRSTTVTWRMEAVNTGSFGVYVTVLRDTGAARPPAVGPALRVSVAQRTTLNSGGILPLALGIPALLGILTLGLRIRRRG